MGGSNQKRRRIAAVQRPSALASVWQVWVGKVSTVSGRTLEYAAGGKGGFGGEHTRTVRVNSEL
jgi:hypothetical protein